MQKDQELQITFEALADELMALFSNPKMYILLASYKKTFYL